MSTKKKVTPIKKGVIKITPVSSKKPMGYVKLDELIKQSKTTKVKAVPADATNLLKAKRKSARITVCDEARAAVYGPRNKDYGSVTDNFGMTAKMWSAILGVSVSAKDVGLCMVALKVSREKFCSKRDNLVDIAGYAATLEKLGLGE